MTTQLRERSTSETPTVVCAWCESVLERGSAVISHGICLPCAAQFIAAATGEAPKRVTRKLAAAS